MHFAGRCRAALLLIGLAAAPVLAQPAALFGRHVRTHAELATPVSAAFDREGRLYVALAGGHRIEVFSAQGARAGALGREGRGAGELCRPSAVAVGPDGAVYVADCGNDRIALFGADGAFVTTWGSRGRGRGEFLGPSALAVDARHVYVLDAGNERVQVMDRDGRVVRVIDCDASVLWSAIAVDSSGGLLLTDARGHRVQRMTPEGKMADGWGDWGSGQGMLAAPRGVAAYGDDIFVAEAFNHRIQVFSAAGSPRYEWGLHVLRPHEGEGHIHYPAGVAVSADGQLIAVCEPLEDRVQVFGRLGAGEKPPERLTQGPAPGAHFGERLDVSGDYLAVVEPEGQSVQLYDTSRATPLNISTIGTYGSKPGQFREPQDVALDAARGVLTVLDSGNRRVQRFRVAFDPQADIAFSLRMHRLVQCVSFEALGAQATQSLEWPFRPIAIARGAHGRHYLLDERNARVLVFDDAWRLVASWGTFGDQAGGLRRPVDIAVGENGDVLVLDADRRSIEVFDADGRHRFSLPISTPQATSAGEHVSPGRTSAPPIAGVASEPYGLAVTREAVFVADRGKDMALKLDLSGKAVACWGGRGLGPGEFFKPSAAAIDARGRLLILDHGNHRGQYLTTDGVFLHAFGARYYVLPTRSAGRGATTAPSSAGTAAAGGEGDSVAVEAERLSTYPLRGWSNAGGYFVALRPSEHPLPLNEPFELEVLVLDANDWTRAPGDIGVTVDADMPEHLHGMNTRPRVRRGGGGVWQVEGMLMHMPGYWEIYVDVTVAGVTERAQFAVTLE